MNNSEDNENDNYIRRDSWHLNKGVPVSLIFAILAQTVVFVWFLATLQSSVDKNAENIIRNEARIDSAEQIVQHQSVVLARIDENLKAIRDAIERNERNSERFREGQRKEQ